MKRKNVDYRDYRIRRICKLVEQGVPLKIASEFIYYPSRDRKGRFQK